MKIIVSMDEVKQIVKLNLLNRGLNLKVSPVEVVEHCEGRYDDAVTVIDGLAFELEEK